MLRTTFSFCSLVVTFAFAAIVVAGQTPQSQSEAVPTGESPLIRVEAALFTFEVKSCTKLGDRITCELLVTNTAGDRWISIRNRAWTVNQGGTRLIDDLGNEYNDPEGQLGVTELGVDRTVLVTDVPVKATIYFEGVAAGAAGIKLLSIECVAGTESDYEYFVALIKDVPLVPARLKGGQNRQDLNSLRIVTTRELTFDAGSCKRVGTSVVCTVSVTNESDATKTILFDATCSTTKPRLIDDLGKEYGPRLVTVANQRIVSGVSPVCHARQPIAPKGTINASLTFEGVDARAREVKLLRLTVRLDELNRFYVDLKDILIMK